MSSIITVWIDDVTEARLEHAAERYGRDVAQLAENLVSEGALDYARKLPINEDPGRDL